MTRLILEIKKNGIVFFTFKTLDGTKDLEKNN